MSPLALALVLASASLHATWNLFAKRAGASTRGPAFVFSFSALTALLYAPLAISQGGLAFAQVGLAGGLAVLGSAVLHIGYFLSLQRGYRVGDLSLVYPLARGGGPLLATLGAIAWLGERPSGLALTGTALVVVATITLASGRSRIVGSVGRLAPGLLWGAVTAVFIGSYTLWDARAVSLVGVPPLLYLWWSELLRDAPAGAIRAVAPRRPAPGVDRAPQLGVRHRAAQPVHVPAGAHRLHDGAGEPGGAHPRDQRPDRRVAGGLAPRRGAAGEAADRGGCDGGGRGAAQQGLSAGAEPAAPGESSESGRRVPCGMLGHVPFRIRPWNRTAIAPTVAPARPSRPTVAPAAPVLEPAAPRAPAVRPRGRPGGAAAARLPVAAAHARERVLNPFRAFPFRAMHLSRLMFAADAD
jgi:drug/metabolite transporter (DMT)-like permease